MPTKRCAGIHAKVKELNDHILPAGVKVVPFIDRSDLVHYTTHTVLHNLTEGIILVVIVLFLFLGNVRGAIIVALTIPFSLLFAATCLNLKDIPANLLSLGALDFGMVVDGAVVMVENIVRHIHNAQNDGSQASDRYHPRRRSRSAAPGLLRHRHHHHRLPAHLHAATSRRQTVQAHGLDGGLRSAGRADLLHADRAGSLHFVLSQRSPRMAQPVDGVLDRSLSQSGALGHRAPLHNRGDWRRRPRAGPFSHFSGVIGSEFLPHLDEGALWVRGTLAPSTGPSEGIRVANQARTVLCSFPEVPQCTSQVGRPDDGTDTTGFFNTEYFVDLKPKEAVASRLSPG